MNELIIMSHPREMVGPSHVRSLEVSSHTILVNGFIAEKLVEGCSEVSWSYGNEPEPLQTPYDAFLATRIKHYEKILKCNAKLAASKLSQNSFARSVE